MANNLYVTAAEERSGKSAIILGVMQMILKEIGRICALAVKTMSEALEPGITTRELDAIGRRVLEENGATVEVK